MRDSVRLSRAARLRGELTVPGDKSVSHRAAIFGALADGHSRIKGYSPAADCHSTLLCLRALGVDVEESDGEVVLIGHGVAGLREPTGVLDAGNSGTTMRLLSGVLAATGFYSVLDGDASLRQRPMRRVVAPLREMGASVWGRKDNTLPPLTIVGHRPLRAIDYSLPVASAQVKSAILLAGLYADGMTRVSEPAPSRDHTERMLSAMGATITINDNSVTIDPLGDSLAPLDIDVPGDFSSAAFFMVAATIVPDSELTIRAVGINPTRTGLVDVLREMGGDVSMNDTRMAGGEPVADITVRSSSLRATTIQGSLIPRLIDELPVLAVAATQAEGTTIVRDAEELRFKESDRVATIVSQLGAMGARIEATPDGFMVHGPSALKGCDCRSFGDHRLAMALSVAALVADGETFVNESSSVRVSFPDFFEGLSHVAIP